MFDPSLRRAPGSDVDRHLAHGKLQPVLHPAVTLAVIALIYFAAEPSADLVLARDDQAEPLRTIE